MSLPEVCEFGHKSKKELQRLAEMELAHMEAYNFAP